MTPQQRRIDALTRHIISAPQQAPHVQGQGCAASTQRMLEGQVRPAKRSAYSKHLSTPWCATRVVVKSNLACRAAQVAIITGSGQGLGAAAAKLFAQHGARVLVTDLDGGKAEQVLAGLAAGCRLSLDAALSPAKSWL